VKVKQQDEQELLLAADKEEMPEGLSEEEEIIIDSKPEKSLPSFKRSLQKTPPRPSSTKP
jgi:hypothetical protein